MSNPILRVIDFFDEIATGSEKKAANMTVVGAYLLFLLCAAVVAKEFSDRDFSAVLTAGSGAQCLGFFLLLHKIKVQNSVAGISSKTLEMYVLVLIFRLCSTLFKNGYLPVDKSGDFVYQVCDVASLLVLFQLIYCVRVKNADTYQREYDSLPIYRALPGCMAMGVGFHGPLNHAPFFDSVWTIAMNIDMIAMLPQLYMLVMKGGEVEALTSNYIAAVFVSRCCATAFWCWGYDEMAPKDGSLNYAGYWCLFAHGVSVLVSADFMYHYWEAKSGRLNGGCGATASKPVVLPPSSDVLV